MHQCDKSAGCNSAFVIPPIAKGNAPIHVFEMAITGTPLLLKGTVFGIVLVTKVCETVAVV